jgi:prepilin signal peptidase PulO-like enzyme (type II secretory pathway)
MTMVEGVAHCGGGKWTNIKKLIFSSIGYRTIIDLKVNFSPRRLTFLHYYFFIVFSLLYFFS